MKCASSSLYIGFENRTYCLAGDGDGDGDALLPSRKSVPYIARRRLSHRDQHLRMATPRRASYKAADRQPERIQGDQDTFDQRAAAGMSRPDYCPPIGTPCTGRPSRAPFRIKLSKHEYIEVGELFVMNNGRPQRVTPTMTPTKEKASLSQ